jgi:Flp pilus assembly protein TadD
MGHRLRPLVAIGAILWIAPALLNAQKSGSPPSGPTPLGSPSRIPGVLGFGSAIVYLRTEDGQKLPDAALPVLRISADASDTTLPNQPQIDGDGWIINGLPIGNAYHLTATANGYQTAREAFEIPQVDGTVANVIVFMKPMDQSLIFRPPNGAFVLAPKAQKEVQHALEDLQQGKMVSAQKHAEKALQLAPGNPYVQFVMGMTYLLNKEMDSAKPYLEKSVSIDPTQPVALAALGGLRYQQGDDKGAIEVLTKAVQLDPRSWKSEWYLACSYFRQRQFKESRDHAQQALKVGKERAKLAEVVLGEAQADLGERENAIATFEKFATENPKDPNTKDVLHWIEILRKPSVEGALPNEALVSAPLSTVGARANLPLPSIEIPPREDWAPKDIDAVQPFVISNASCSLPKILESAGKNAENLVKNLQEFSATEDFQEIEVKRTGEFERPVARSFTYLVFIDQVSPHGST